MSKRLVKIGEAAQLLGTTPNTLRKWEVTGELLPKRKTQGGTRYYEVAELLNLGNEDAPTVCYARVSSHDQKEDLQRQQQIFSLPSSAYSRYQAQLGNEVYTLRSNAIKLTSFPRQRESIIT